jgi:hypothetical protein
MAKRSFYKYTFLILLCILIFFVVFFYLRFETFDQPPITEQVSITMIDITKPANNIDPEALGKYYVTSNLNYSNKSTFQMYRDQSSIIDSSNVSIQFDPNNVTTLVIYPIQIKPKDPHKANIFPPTFTLNITLPAASNQYKLQHQDISANSPRNTLTPFSIPGSNVSGDFINILSANSVMQTPFYTNDDPKSAIGYIEAHTKNTFKITVTESGNTVAGFLLNLSVS